MRCVAPLRAAIASPAKPMSIKHKQDEKEPSQFGKRGRIVKPLSQPPSTPPARPAWLKWIAGALAALALLSFLPFSGGSLLGGLLGGLLAHKLLGKGSSQQTSTVKPTPGAPSAAAAGSAQTTIARGGFGATGAASAGASVGG